MTLCKKYLILPIKNGAPKPQVTLTVDDKTVRCLGTQLASSADDISWWAFLDISAYKNKTATLAVSGVSEEGFKLIKQSDNVPGEDKWGDEPLRPQFHFSQKVGWNNDPNGMVYYDGEWHLYFQHNPVGWGWGNMTWGHAVSKDLVSWKQLPNALHHRHRDAMFSGGAAVDWKNTGGWKTGDTEVIIATWTSTGRGECIAYSNDKGRTFTEYEGNPVIKHSGRDPKPLWYKYGEKDQPISDKAKELGGHWVIAVFDQDKEHGKNIALYTSTDLKKWDLQSKLPGYFECAELFELPVDGDGKHRVHWGNYYASQLFSDAPKNRRIQIGWARFGMPGMPFNQTMGFPTELTLRTTKDGIRMFVEPVKEIEKIHGKKHEEKDKALTEDQPVGIKSSGALFDIRAAFEVGTAKVVGLDVDGQKIPYVVEQGKLDMAQGMAPIDGKVKIQLLIDRPMIEICGNQGRIYITRPFKNDLNIESIKAYCEGGEAKLLSLEVYELDAKWDN
jgi:fructan beta-fructosidase